MIPAFISQNSYQGEQQQLMELSSKLCTCLYTPGGHSHWKGVRGCAAVMTPFFQASRRSLAYQFTLNAQLLWPPFSIFRKFLNFQPCFGQNSSSLDPDFSKFSFPRPLFFKENPLPRPYILKPMWHTSTKKKSWVPPRVIYHYCEVYFDTLQ